MIQKTARIVSWLFHPLVMPSIGILIIMFSNSYLANLPLEAKRLLVLLVSIGTLFLPALMIPVFLARGLVSTVNVNERKERILPLIITSVFFVITFVLFLKIPVYRFIHAFILGSALVVITNLLITIYWKISAHMMGIGGITALILVLSVYLHVNMLLLLMLAFLVGGITGTARIVLKSHSPAEIYLGFAAGFMLMTCSLVLY